MKQPQKKPETITITNFAGRLTRYLNGQLNSGFAKFNTSFGYDPFSKPGNLTWLYMPDDISGTTITDVVLSSKTISPTALEEYVYAIGNNARLYKIDPTNSSVGNTPLNDSPSLIGALTSIIGTLNYGSDLDYYNNRLNFTSDAWLNQSDLNGSVLSRQSVTGGIYHPVAQFQGSLFVGNGNNLMQVDSTNLIVKGAVLSPGLPTGMFIKDLDVTPDGTYLIITASYVYPDRLDNTTGNVQAYAVESYKFLWNGTDLGVTAYEALPSFPATSLSTFLNKQFTFMQDAFGAALFEGPQKVLTLPNNLSPMPSATTPNGTFLTWVSPEGTGAVNSSGTNYTGSFSSLYYYGQLDTENPAGLWRLFRQTPTTNYKAFHAPINQMVNSFSLTNGAVAGWGKHYISVWEYRTSNSSSSYHFFRFVLPPAANTSPILGVWETQTQLFSKRIGLSQIRVYCEPTVAGNGFQLDVIDVDGSVVSNASFTYTFGDPISKSERINFNPNCDTLYGFAIRITNTGTTNMTIKKVEIDLDAEGK